jgi:hypothetical protein
VKLTAPALLTLFVLLSLPAAAVAAGSSSTDDVPVRGGIAALSDAIPLSPVPDRARFISEAIRVVYSWPQAGPYTNEPMRRRIAAFFATGNNRANDAVDDIPVPLTAAIWGQAVFHKTVRPEDLVAAILADRSAALTCYSLAALDEDTLQFFADRPSLLSRMVERAPATFAAFGESIHVHDGRLVAPGGDAAAPVWESIVGEKLDRPDRFLPLLFESDRGRVAYLFDVLTHLDAATLAAVIGPNGGNPDALKRLAALVRRAFPEWDVTTAPFVRPPAELAAFFGRMHAAADARAGAAAFRSTAFWQRVFDEPSGSADSATDIAWLAEAVVGHPAREREQRLELFSFVERVFGTAGTTDDVAAAAAGIGPYGGLMLTLERMGIRTPSTYIAARQQAERLTALDATRGAIALAQFQGALALAARLIAVGSIDAPAAEAAARELFALRLDDSGRYNGAIAAWIADRIVPLLPREGANATIDDIILAGAAGPPAPPGGARVEWEGQRYRVDPGGAERIRLRRARDRQESVTFASALAVAAVVRQLNAAMPTVDAVRSAATILDTAANEIAAAERAADEPSIRLLRSTSRTLAAVTRPGDAADARRAAGALAAIADEMLGHVLVSFAYACDLGDPDGTILIAGDPSRRHEFGYDAAGRDARVKAMWGIASIETRKGPWHLVGSALALDLAMAPLALRRISVDRVPESPMLNLMQRDGFAATVAVMNTAALRDGDRDRIAGYISDGRRRVMEAVEGGESPESIARTIDLDGWRARALIWTIAHDPQRTPALFSLTELLVLGGGSPAAFNPWGTYALRTAGCLCPRLAAPNEWRRWWGLSQAGLPAILVADLPLNVAVVLHNLQLPAALAKPVLAAAMQDFVDGTNPTDGNDWLTLSRAAQAIDRTRFEDYIASAAADGPLVSEADTDNR